MIRHAPALLLAFAVSSIPAFAEAEERGALVALFYEQVRSCYTLPIEACGTEPVVVEARLKPNGALEREPEVIRGSPHSLNAKAALRAFHKCAPFRVPKEWTQRYRDWKVLRVQFSTIR